METHRLRMTHRASCALHSHELDAAAAAARRQRRSLSSWLRGLVLAELGLDDD